MWLARLGVALAFSAAALPLSAVAQAISVDQFQSPSGNIFCAIGVLDTGKAFAECEIHDRSGMTCTDNSSGHFFTISRESYDLG